MTATNSKGEKMRLTFCAKLCYGVGHILNDLCASMWFTYLLVFYTLVVQLSPINAGLILLIGQVADALSTPVVGILSDRWKSSFTKRYGKRKTWHLIGTICVLCSVPFMYSPCIGLENSVQWKKIIYYSVFVAIFQFGWASVQISHLSLVPDLTPSETERTSLLSVRYSFTVLSNMAVYIITWAVLEADGSDNKFDSKDMIKFQEIAYIICVCGAVASIIFHISVKELPLDQLLVGENASDPKKRLPLRHLFSNWRLYAVAVVYMSARLFCNISQSQIPLYLHYALDLQATRLAIIPLVMYLSSFFTSLVTGPMNKFCGRQITVVVGGVIGIGGSIWIWFGMGTIFMYYLIYIVAILFGCASSILLITSLAVTADLIGGDVGNGALIYGTMSFVDKISSGATIMIIQALTPTDTSKYYQSAVAYVCGGAAVLGILFIFTVSSCKSSCNVRPDETDEIPDSSNSA